MFFRNLNASSAYRVAIAIFVVTLTLCSYKFYFGTADVEESANSLYSIGARNSLGSDAVTELTHSALGIPVFDTRQGTGDRLPYQASWAQSASWPIRFLLSDEMYSLVRSFLFMVPALQLGMTTLLSWRPCIQMRYLILFGFLSNSSFGLFLRQNEWSDHYVQVIGISSIAIFLMRMDFHVEPRRATTSSDRVTLLCLFLSVNGVLTGHPGLWPVALFVWFSLLATFLPMRIFRQSLCHWMSSQIRVVSLLLSASFLTLITVIQDLLAEINRQEAAVGRLSRTAGLFSEYSFGGLYGLSQGGSIPESVKGVISAVLATTSMPLFMLFDGVLPQMFRASDFREVTRVEFSGALVILALATAWKGISRMSFRTFVLRLLLSQILIWISVVLSVLDAVPVALASSGAWMTLTVVLTMNLFVSILLFREMPRERRLARLINSLNILSIGYWFLIQIGFASFGTLVEVPVRFESRSESLRTLADSEWSKENSRGQDRVILLTTPSFYDSLRFISLGFPVVAPSDPKTRNSSQLRSTFSFDYSINPPRFESMSREVIERTMDFLQVKHLLVGEATQLDVPSEFARTAKLQALLTNLPKGADISLPDVEYETYRRNTFTLSVVERRDVSDVPVCPVLYESCPVVTESELIAKSAEPQLRMCDYGCLWKVLSPPVSSSKVLVIPVTYDEALEVRDSAGTKLDTSSVGGFLGVGSKSGVNEGLLTVNLDPDVRMLSRVAMSYANVAVFILLLGNVMYPWVKSLRRKLRVE